MGQDFGHLTTVGRTRALPPTRDAPWRRVSIGAPVGKKARGLRMDHRELVFIARASAYLLVGVRGVMAIAMIPTAVLGHQLATSIRQPRHKRDGGIECRDARAKEGETSAGSPMTTPL